MMRTLALAGLISLLPIFAACGQADPSGEEPAESATGSNSTQTDTGPSNWDEPEPVFVNGFRELTWEELMPEGEEERLAQMYQQQMAMLYSGGPIAEGSAADTMIQIGTFNVVEELDGTKIRIPGYTVPFEYGRDAQIEEFLLVPYFGACIHAPPPPPNQTLYITTDEAIQIQDLAQAVWINGTIRTAKASTELADAAYSIEMDSIETYEY